MKSIGHFPTLPTGFQRRAVFEIRWKDFEHELQLRVHMGLAEVDDESPSL
jgi:hypothetical protein